MEEKAERSISAQTRIDIITLAELTVWWEEERKENITSLSQLIRWSVEVLHDILKDNKMIKQEVSSAIEARKLFELRGLFQKSLKKKDWKKMGVAVRFEGMRAEGRDPKTEYPKDYNVLHNHKTSQKHEVTFEPETSYGNEIEEAMRRSIEESKKEATEQFKSDNRIASEEDYPLDPDFLNQNADKT